MGWFDKLMGRDAPAEVAPDEMAALAAEREATVEEYVQKSHMVEAARPFPNRPDIIAAGLRPGMWVMTSDGIGIITGCPGGGIGQVTLVKDDGTTKMMLNEQDQAVPHVVLGDLSTLTQATIEDIVVLHSPLRPAPEVGHLERLGYRHKEQA